MNEIITKKEFKRVVGKDFEGDCTITFRVGYNFKNGDADIVIMDIACQEEYDKIRVYDIKCYVEDSGYFFEDTESEWKYFSKDDLVSYGGKK